MGSSRPLGLHGGFLPRVLLTSAWLAVCLLLPLASFAYTSLVELHKHGSLDGDAWSTAAFFAVLWSVGLLGSGVSLLWTTWGRPPRPMLLHTWCWAALFLPCCAPFVLLGLGLATGRLLADLAAAVVVCSSLGLLASVMLGWLLVLPLHLVLGRARGGAAALPPRA